MDSRPPGYITPEGDVHALERMLGTLDWGALHTASLGTSAGHPDIAEQSHDTRSHLQLSSAPSDDPSQQPRDEGHHRSSEAPKQQRRESDGHKSEKMQQMRARHREAQARYRAKHRVRVPKCCVFSQLYPYVQGSPVHAFIYIP
jgi:hypothetical protein